MLFISTTTLPPDVRLPAGPVFVEFPIDTLYQYDLVKREIGMKDQGPTSLMQKVVNWWVSPRCKQGHQRHRCYEDHFCE